VKVCHFTKQVAVASKNFDLVHSDIWGSAPVSSLFDYNYYACFVEDCFLIHMGLSHAKVKIYIEFTNMIYTQFHKRIKIFRSDGVR